MIAAWPLLLYALFSFTRFGLATRAAAENEKGAIVLGFSPDFLAGANWVLATVFVGLLRHHRVGDHRRSTRSACRS